MRVQLKARERPHVVDAFFDTFLQSQCLVRTGDDDDHFTRLTDVRFARLSLDGNAYIQHCLDPNRQGHPWNLIQVVAEEPRICKNSIIGKSLHTGPGLETGARFVEGNVAIGSNTAQEQLDASCVGDLVLVCLAFGFQIRSIAIEDIDVFRSDVYVREEMLVHEAVVAFGVFPRDPDILVLQLISH